MTTLTLYSVGKYSSPFTQDDRDRTIAAMYVTQRANQLGYIPMRRDVLTFLTSSSAVGYWLREGQLEKCGKSGKINLVKLTTKGINLCGSLKGPSDNVNSWINKMSDDKKRIGEAKIFKQL